MNISNFSLITDESLPGWPRVIEAFGISWDLHNDAEFDGFEYSNTITKTNSSLILKWRIAELTKQWRNVQGEARYPCGRFCIVFTDVDYLEIVPRDVEMPKSEDIGTSSISFIDASASLAEYQYSPLIPGYDPSKGTLPYHIEFLFNGGQIIRVGSDTAEFVLNDGPDRASSGISERPD